MARRRVHPHYLINLGLSLVVLAVFAVTGIRIANTSSAATANPYGEADYCTLEDNLTIIYGWAADPDAGSLGQPSVMVQVGTTELTVPTNRSDYRDNAIGSWIDTNRKGDPKRGTYGFRAAIPGLYKGTRYPISGTVLNEGAGTSVILNINNSMPVDDDSRKKFFQDNVIPDECLAMPGTAPVPAVTNSNALTAPTALTSNTAGASVLTGSMAAELKIRADGSQTARVVYGIHPAKLDQSSPDIALRGDETTVALTGLEPATAYSYRIVRTNSAGKQTTSGAGNFTTLGFVVALHFTDSKTKGLQGISASITGQDKKKISDENGDIQFLNLRAGNYTAAYTYMNKEFSRSIAANASSITPAEAAAARVVTLDFTIDIEAALTAAPKPAVKPGNDGFVSLMIGGMVMLALVIVAITFSMSRRGRKKAIKEAVLDSPPPPLPNYVPLSQVPPSLPPEFGAEHMGESLKDLVIRSMTVESKHSNDGRGRRNTKS